MRHGDTKTGGLEEARRSPSGFPNQGTLAAALLGFLPLLTAGSVAAADALPTKAHSGWAEVITVDERHAQAEVLRAVFAQVVAAGVNGGAAAQLLKHVGAYIDSEIAERGSAIVSVGMLVDAVEAAQSAKWSAEDTARLVVALQRDLNERRVGENIRLQALIARVNHGSKPDQILGNGEALKEAQAP